MPQHSTATPSRRRRKPGSSATTAIYLALLDYGHNRRVLVANHEYTDEILMHAGYDAANPTRAQAEIAWAAHGLSVVVLDEDRGGRLRPVVGHRINRRITATTPITLTGPAAGGAWLKTSADPSGTRVLGTLNNCGVG